MCFGGRCCLPFQGRRSRESKALRHTNTGGTFHFLYSFHPPTSLFPYLVCRLKKKPPFLVHQQHWSEHPVPLLPHVSHFYPEDEEADSSEMLVFMYHCIRSHIPKTITLKSNVLWTSIDKSAVFKCIIPFVFYLQLNRGYFESKYNYLMSLSLFKFKTCFGPCTGTSSGHKIYNWGDYIQCESQIKQCES
jgi:hypothetical protein